MELCVFDYISHQVNYPKGTKGVKFLETINFKFLNFYKPSLIKSSLSPVWLERTPKYV